MLKDRYLINHIVKDLKEKMVFLGGPRQVGKTTFARELVGKQFSSPAYFNWDKREEKRKILEGQWPAEADLIIIDELHKYAKWKSFIKGEYDSRGKGRHFLITGSARLNIYQRGGDSLLGRYHYYRLHPFSYAEILKIKNKIEAGRKLSFKKSRNDRQVVERLFHFGGFPEIYLKAKESSLRRWHNARKELLFKEDIRDLTAIKDIGSMEILSEMLPKRVASLLSINSLREDIGVTHKSVVNWINALESLYYCYRIYPFQGNNIKSLKKEAKLYLWDWSEVEDPAHRLENMIASHLLKLIHYLYDVHGYKANLYYLRDVDKREVDFLVTLKEKPWFAVEVKMSDKKISLPLRYFKERVGIPYSYQVVKSSEEDYEKGGIHLLPLERFLSGLV